MEKPDELSAAGPSSRATGRASATGSSSEQDIQQLKAEISENQAQLQETVAEIQERLSPSHLKEQATEAVRDATVGRVQHMMNRVEETAGQVGRTTRRAADNVVSEVRSSPIPYALIAFGAAWLLANRRSRRHWDDNEYGSSQFSSSEYASSEYGSAGFSGHGPSARPTPGSIGPGETNLGGWGTGARERARRVTSRARSGWETMLHENPLVLGVAAMATGALVAAALPSTEVENRYMGEARETVVESARQVAEDAVGKVAGTASEQQST